MTFKSCIYEGLVYHKRFHPKVHELKYKVFSCLFDLDELDQLDQKLKFFSLNKFNLFSFHNKDFGPKSHQPLRPYVEKTLSDHGFKIHGGSILLLCYPRLFGYAFNPLSVYYCYDNDEQLRAIIYEVSNTFKERHSYVIPIEGDQSDMIEQSCDKGFYVSPFMEMNCSYHFKMQPPCDRVNVDITQKDPSGTLLRAFFKGKKAVLSDRKLISLLFKYPLMTLKVIIGIHWEALHLWRKGLKLVKRPAAPKQSISFIKSSQTETRT